MIGYTYWIMKYLTDPAVDSQPLSVNFLIFFPCSFTSLDLIIWFDIDFIYVEQNNLRIVS